MFRSSVPAALAYFLVVACGQPPSAPPAPSPSAGSGTGIVRGVLTAGVWDDNRNFALFVAYAAAKAATLRGLPVFTSDERFAAAEAAAAPSSARQAADIALLIDTTG